MSVETFLRQRAVNVVVSGNYTLPNWYDPQGKLRTFACRTSRISPFRMIVDAPVVGKVGDRLKSYFRDFGKFDGLISETKVGSFLLELEMPQSMRANFASKLTWLEKKQKEPTILDLRKEARIIPANPHTTLTLADGTLNECFVIDMSVSGVGGLCSNAAANWNAPGHRSLRRPRRQNFARWFRNQVCRTAKTPRS